LILKDFILLHKNKAGFRHPTPERRYRWGFLPINYIFNIDNPAMYTQEWDRKTDRPTSRDKKFCIDWLHDKGVKVPHIFCG
jgi:hypothetical protein